MPDEIDDGTGPAGSARGARRRDQLVRAGLELLAERGWSGLTARAVAERAGTHQGLVHYHFGGLPSLKRAVAETAVLEVFEPAVAALTAETSWPAGVAAVLRTTAQPEEPRAARITAELVVASLQDPEVGELVRSALADARARLVPWLSATGEAEPQGLATLLLAALDGLVLHRLLDPALALDDVAAAAEALAAAASPSPSADPGTRP
ncbi:transcriptional regulator, TetR family [Geodermatophilus saharensis]|uniref:Transcriptional regulator, TetR family n=1 Tax=Geodermatophilus saharensis TaxID=1137994 RepID=A0A239D8F3_9ACTN|nr:TetR/AcrR family transcriptional regulator [Geodermatophilus saharensis]SNS28655.1 transcriptional regulator, TetR family [Geodermatophilus saharensis]